MHKSQKACGAVGRCCVAGLGLLVLAGSRQAARAQEWAQPPAVHYRWSQESAPGAIGREQVRQGIVPPGYFQPVRVLGPEGLEVGVRSGAGEEVTLKAPADFALRVGAVYRLRLRGIPEAVGAELFPSVELIDRLHPPQGVAGRHPIPIHLTQEDLELALTGRLVTKVIYLEQQEFALPTAREEGETPIYDARPDQDALEAADIFGRPVAIVRLGQWAPLEADWSDDPLGPPGEVIFPIGGGRDASSEARHRTVPRTAKSGIERGGGRGGTAGQASSGTQRAQEAVRGRGVGRVELLFPPNTREELGGWQAASPVREAQHREVLHEGRRRDRRGWRAVGSEQREVSGTRYGTVDGSSRRLGEQGGWRRRGGG